MAIGDVEILARADRERQDEVLPALAELPPATFSLHRGGSRPTAILHVSDKTFFVKRHLSPKLPAHGAATRQRRAVRCALFIRRITSVISRLDQLDSELPARPVLLARNATTFLTMHEFLPGRKLTPPSFRALPLPRQVAILDHLADQIETLHGLGLAHLDVRPDNIILPDLEEHGPCSLIDLDNCSKLDGDPLSAEGSQSDLLYSPPDDENADGCSRDSYAFAMTTLALVSPPAFRLRAGRPVTSTGSATDPSHRTAARELEPWAELIGHGLGPHRRISELRRLIPEIVKGAPP